MKNVTRLSNYLFF